MKKKRYCPVIVLISVCVLVGCTQWTQAYYQQGAMDQATNHPYHIQKAMPTLSQPANFYVCGDQTSTVPCMPKTKLDPLGIKKGKN